MEAHLVMATVFKTAELGVNRPVGGFDSHTLPLFIFGLQETRHRLLKVLNVQPERKKLTESIWFWIYLFSTAGLIGLVILQGKFDARQDLERSTSVLECKPTERVQPLRFRQKHLRMNKLLR